MQNHKVVEVDSHKHLCVELSSDCSWHQHIKYITDKAWNRINIMRKLKFKLDRKSLEIIYIAFIRPLLEYGDIIWDTCTQYEKNELDKIQNETARIATGTTKLVSIHVFYSELRWDTLQQPRNIHKLTLLYKMTHNLTPEYLSSLVPEPISNISSYNLRNSNNFRAINTRTSQYYQSFLPSTVRSWNDLPVEAHQYNTLNSFKHFLNKGKARVPQYFYTGSRKARILHTPLRTNCSSLNLDLFMKNITDSPLCSCGSAEDAQHFFFHCHNYQAQRNELLNSISLYHTPSLQLLLQGELTLAVETNKIIFEKVQKFIIETKRF